MFLLFVERQSQGKIDTDLCKVHFHVIPMHKEKNFKKMQVHIVLFQYAQLYFLVNGYSYFQNASFKKGNKVKMHLQI